MRNYTYPCGTPSESRPTLMLTVSLGDGVWVEDADDANDAEEAVEAGSEEGMFLEEENLSLVGGDWSGATTISARFLTWCITPDRKS